MVVKIKISGASPCVLLFGDSLVVCETQNSGSFSFSFSLVKQTQFLHVELFIIRLIALISNVATDRVFTAIPTGTTNEIATRPKRPTPAHLFQVADPKVLSSPSAPAEDLAGSDTFDDAGDLGGAVGWNGLDQKMDMILVRSNFKKGHFIAVCNIETYPAQNGIDFLGNHSR